jgi:hypothetical protein
LKDAVTHRSLVDRHSAHEHSREEQQLEELRSVFLAHLPACHCSFDVH